MRELKYKNPYKLNQTTIENGKYLFEEGRKYYERVNTVFTKFGVVVVTECDWETNNGKIKFTIFKTSINGMIYQAELAEQRLSERQIKWLATHFIKQFKKRDQKGVTPEIN